SRLCASWRSIPLGSPRGAVSETNPGAATRRGNEETALFDIVNRKTRPPGCDAHRGRKALPVARMSRYARYSRAYSDMRVGLTVRLARPGFRRRVHGRHLVAGLCAPAHPGYGASLRQRAGLGGAGAEAEAEQPVHLDQVELDPVERHRAARIGQRIAL